MQRSLPHLVTSLYKIAILFECGHKLRNDPLDHFLICTVTESNFT